MSKKKNRIKWEYAHDADITIGEVKFGKGAKVLITFICLILLGGIGTGIYFKDNIYDYIVNPGVILKSKSVELEVGSEFKPKQYIVEDCLDKKITIYYPASSDVNTKKLGEYTAVYKSTNSMNKTEIPLKVKVVDKKEPEIILKSEALVLTRGEETEKFNPENQIDYILDNYDISEDCEVEFTNNLDFTKDQLTLTYTATDKSGNVGTTDLKLMINDPLPDQPTEEEKKAQEEKERKEREAREKKIAEEAAKAEREKVEREKQNNNSNNSNGNSSNTNSSGRNNTSTTSGGSSKPSKYIKGVHDISVPVGTPVQTMVQKLISGVSGSGSISVQYQSVNLTRAGKYTVTFTSSDGLSKKAVVTVTN